jgi:hypothetical protein
VRKLATAAIGPSGLIGMIGIAVAACYAPTPPLQVACSPSGACPDGQMCIAQTCVEIGAGVPDRDRDGRPDTADNCPDGANPDQTDEDKDRLGDVCDPCPMVNQGDATDGDGDGVPDVCDLNAATGARDTSWLFYGFEIVPSWEGSSGWAPASDNDSLRTHAAGADADEPEYLDLPIARAGRTLDNFAVRIALAIEEPLGVYPQIGLSLDGADGSIDCTLSQVGNQTTMRQLGLVDDFVLDDTRTFAWQRDAAYTLTLVRHGTSYTCTVEGAGGPAMRTGTSPVRPTGGTVWAHGVTATVDWLFVVGGP